MAGKLVRAETDSEGNVIRIYRDKSWRDNQTFFRLMDRAEAVGLIREQVFSRQYDPQTKKFLCQRCGRSIAWSSFEMHETIPKGSGGEVSLENCEALCHQCHTGSQDSAHGNRRWQTSKLKSDKGQND